MTEELHTNPPVNLPTSSSSASPPPNCAICLGACTNTCFSNSCMHQFCFSCLLEWSKIKPECPLCKQAFKSIIHNVKSINEYDEHVITGPEVPPPLERNDEYLYLPTPPSRHQFHFRTTFTVDPGGELAIQQMLLSHPLTNVMYMPGYNHPPGTVRLHRRRRDTSATSFRRAIYAQNLWVFSPPDYTGRYRSISPFYYSANPGARTRLVPWLNRELNALLRENTQQVMHLVDMILEHLLRYHIRSRTFKNLLMPYLGSKTEHFIHEFHSFMRSPYDMVGYDRHVIYTSRPQSPSSSIDVLSDVDLESNSDNDSDVAFVSTSSPLRNGSNPIHRPTLEVIEINSESSHDSDVIIREPSPPIVVDLVDSDSDDHNNEVTEVPVEEYNNSNNHPRKDEKHQPILPLKIRLKNKRKNHEKRSAKKRRKSHRSRSFTSSASSSSEDGNSTPYEQSGHDKRKKRKKYKKFKHKLRKMSKCRTEIECTHLRKGKYSDFDTDDDNIPLSQLQRNKKGGNRASDNSDSDSSLLRNNKNCWSELQPKCENQFKQEAGSSGGKYDNAFLSSSSSPKSNYRSSYHSDMNTSTLYETHHTNSCDVSPRSSESCFESPCQYLLEDNSSAQTSKHNELGQYQNVTVQSKIIVPTAKLEERGTGHKSEKESITRLEENNYPGPSCSSGRLRNILLRKNCDLWYLRPPRYSSDSSDA